MRKLMITLLIAVSVVVPATTAQASNVEAKTPPTALCKDGTRTPSWGRGSCSWHGGCAWSPCKKRTWWRW
jgi:hypothetical protein